MNTPASPDPVQPAGAGEGRQVVLGQIGEHVEATGLSEAEVGEIGRAMRQSSGTGCWPSTPALEVVERILAAHEAAWAEKYAVVVGEREFWRAERWGAQALVAEATIRARSAEAALATALREQAEVRAEDPFVVISTALDAKRPDLAGTELQMWRRVTKVCEESGEVWRALSGYVAENPRKGQTHTLDDLRGELLDTASAALCAWAHLNDNEGDPVAALLTHVAGTADRLRAALTIPTATEDE